MMNRLSGSEPGRSHPPAPKAPSGEKQQTQQPSVPGACRASDRRVAAAVVSDSPEALIRTQLPRPEDQARIDIRSPAWHLPALVLNKIVGYLPPGAQCRCARVCRHWYDCLPGPKVRLMQWLQKNAPVSCLADPGLGRGFNERVGPFLRATQNPILPVLTHLQQEQKQQQEQEPGLTDTRPASQQPLHAPATCDLLSSLVHYGLSQQLTQAHQLRMRPSPLDWPDAAQVATYTFSPCSRWLALSCKLRADSPRHLRLYGWEQGVWQRCPMASEEVEPVGLFSFTQIPADTLVSAHGVNILAWSKTPDTKTWHSTLMCRCPATYEVDRLISMRDGDQIVIAVNTRQERTVLRALFCRHTGHSNTWERIMTQDYEFDMSLRVDITWNAAPESCQLALATRIRTAHSDAATSEVHIWRKGLNSSRPEQWGCQKSVIPRHEVAPHNIGYSPGGQYLLAQLLNGRVCWWKLDAQCRLQEQLTVDCLYQPECEIESVYSFRRDEKQLALAQSLSQVQLFDCDRNGHWQYGPLLEAPPVPHAPPEDKVHTVQLAASGRILLRGTRWCVDIWHQDATGRWQHFLQHQRQETHRFASEGCLSELGELVYTATADPEQTLQVYGPAHQAQLIKKACMPISAAVGSTSPDGLSVFLFDSRNAPIVLQLVPTRENRHCSLL